MDNAKSGPDQSGAAGFRAPWGIVLAGLAVGAGAGLLQTAGNPGNMGLCVVCFLRDIAGALGLHGADPLRYLRPEITGIVLGSCVAAFAFRGFRSRGGSSPMLRFALGNLMAVGALVFLGCSTRMVLRLGGGDLNALIGLAGFAAGVYAGLACVRHGFSLGAQRPGSAANALAVPVLVLLFLVLLVVGPFLSGPMAGLVLASDTGPGAAHAPLLVALGIGLASGFLLQRTGICTVACLRTPVETGDWKSTWGIGALLAGALVASVATGGFRAGFAGQPLAHAAHLWNFLGMLLLGFAAALADGCPLRQLVRAGEGDADAGFVVLGMLTGSVLAHRFLAASTPKGVAPLGPWLVLAGIGLCVLIGLTVRDKPHEERLSSIS
jgi:YedE family putative selenium metabolism protein